MVLAKIWLKNKKTSVALCKYLIRKKNYNSFNLCTFYEFFPERIKLN